MQERCRKGSKIPLSFLKKSLSPLLFYWVSIAGTGPSPSSWGGGGGALVAAALPGPWWQCCVGGGRVSGGQSKAKRQQITERVPCECSCSHCLLSTRLSKLVKLVGPSFCDSEPSITCAECGQARQFCPSPRTHHSATAAESLEPRLKLLHCRAPNISTPCGRMPPPPIAP